jgi:hypothetical protein
MIRQSSDPQGSSGIGSRWNREGRMPGIWGVVGACSESREKLKSHFERPWGSGESATFGEGALGGHALHPRKPLHQGRDGLWYATDGEASLYHDASELLEQLDPNFDTRSSRFVPNRWLKGVIAIANLKAGLWYLASDWSGNFPLYYLTFDGGLAFCTRQRPISDTFHLASDSLGIIQFLRQGYVLGERTMFAGLRRLTPGQVLVFDAARGTLSSVETSKAWATDPPSTKRGRETAGYCWDVLCSAVKASLPKGRRHTIMLSGGWDSRTLLAAARKVLPDESLHVYSHGDEGGRELEIAKRVAESLGLPFCSERIDDRSLDVSMLDRGFECTEDVRYPWWYRDGEILRQLGSDCVSSGLYGEILGGHYGQAITQQGIGKALSVGRSLLGIGGGRRETEKSSFEYAKRVFQVSEMRRPWFVAEDYWRSLDRPTEAFNAEVEKVLKRLIARGVAGRDRLIECLVTEHRANQMFMTQVLSCRTSMDIAIPLADQELVRLISSIPLSERIHNSLNRRMLLRHSKAPLKFPLAATLVPAAWPISLQEGSRLVRHVCENYWWKVHAKTAGRVKPPRTSWIKFDFLRSGKSLTVLSDQLRARIWDRQAIDARIARLVEGSDTEMIHPVTMVMTTIFTADRFLQ